MTDTLMLSILAMDAYNRDGMGLNVTASAIGSATFENDPLIISSDGFLASDYTIDGNVVIAYAGTNDSEDYLQDLLIGGGFAVDQVQDAVDYYNHVPGRD
jgi:hypothetical protein